jgi:hypothetical protein
VPGRCPQHQPAHALGGVAPPPSQGYLRGDVFRLGDVHDTAGIMLGTYPVMLSDTAGRWWGFLEIDAVLSELDDDVPDGWWSITGDIDP